MRLVEASQKPVAGLERVLYNAQHDFTLQYLLLLAPLRPDDDEAAVVSKLRLVARFLDILIHGGSGTSGRIDYSTMQYAMFLVMRDIRGLAPEPLAHKLRETLDAENETFASNDRFRLHRRTATPIHRILARMTDYVETQSGLPSRYLEYVSEGKGRTRSSTSGPTTPSGTPTSSRTRPTSPSTATASAACCCCPRASTPATATCPTRRSCRTTTRQNLLARSLHPQCYDHNPGFLRFVADERPAVSAARAVQEGRPRRTRRALPPARRAHLESGRPAAGVGAMIADLKPYPAYKDSDVPWLGEVPEHWVVKRNKLFMREVNQRSEDGSEELLTVSQYTGVTRRRERLSDKGDLLTNAAALLATACQARRSRYEHHACLER